MVVVSGKKLVVKVRGPGFDSSQMLKKKLFFCCHY